VEGGGLRRGVIGLPPTRGKSGGAFAPRDKEGDFQVSKRVNSMFRQKGNGEKGGGGNKKGVVKCSLSLWRVARGSKHMFLELIHGLFIT
jgi:hypothetical protein